MMVVDGLSPRLRALVHEYGIAIVAALIADGYHDSEELSDMLETWRERRQAEWLATNYITPRTRRSFGLAA